MFVYSFITSLVPHRPLGIGLAPNMFGRCKKHHGYSTHECCTEVADAIDLFLPDPMKAKEFNAPPA